MSHQNDEETPLLQQQSQKSNFKRTPLPWFQFSLVLFLQLAEPLTSQVISPFTPQLIRDIGITHGDETKVGHYVGLLQSLFFFTQALTILHWARTSDRLGRKPVLLVGLFGISVSMFSFGLSKTFWGLVLRCVTIVVRVCHILVIEPYHCGSRGLNGALNGNIGIIKSIVAEITDSTNLSQAYGFMPIAWSTGGILGPLIGGALSHPVDQIPGVFGHSQFLREYPYFLPCAVPAVFSAIAWIVTLLFLKETVPTAISLSRLFNSRKSKANLTPQTIATGPLPEAFPPTPTLASDIPDNEKPVPLLKLLRTPAVLLSAGNYASLGLVDIAFRAIQPLFFSTPTELGGLGLSPAAIGKILSITGLLMGLLQIFFFAGIHDRLGSKLTFTIGIGSTIPMFLTFPIMRYLVLAKQRLTPLVWVVVGVQTLLFTMPSFAGGAIFIYIQAASPNRASLGATNGLSQFSVSICRAIGPGVANSLFSVSMEKGYLGGYMVYYVLVCLCGLALLCASFLPSR
ncbi:member of major facilitator multidrug-resistance DHA1 sub-family [Marasmius fiardii PR-910]|nr:member of major facilitator multidrug-resistance DHA1 sub-family [Marasmius fiardii PR-910]